MTVRKFVNPSIHGITMPIKFAIVEIDEEDESECSISIHAGEFIIAAPSYISEGDRVKVIGKRKETIFQITNKQYNDIFEIPFSNFIIFPSGEEIAESYNLKHEVV